MAQTPTNSSILTATVAATTALTLATVASGVVGYYLGKKEEAEHSKIPTAIPSSLNGKSRILSIGSGYDVKVEDDHAIVDVRIDQIRPLVPPACLVEEISNQGKISSTVNYGRQGVENILNDLDDRLVVVVGPCSIHDPKAALEYGALLKKLSDEVKEDLHVVMRVYFEKPRTTVGWKGLINDPDLNGTFNINKGLRVARKLLCDLNALGLPAGCEFLDTISPQFTSDLVSWGAIGARTTECQLHRELTSGLSMPIGFKNGTGGSLKLAVDAVVSARSPHCFLSVSTQGLAAIVNTSGNNSCHVILRGGATGPNYEAKYVNEVSELLRGQKVKDKIMIDCSHGNSRKIHSNQILVAADIGKQIAAGDQRIFGVMIESNLKEGNQKLVPGETLVYGKSITDACIDWKTTENVLRDLAKSVRQRRQVLSKKE